MTIEVIMSNITTICHLVVTLNLLKYTDDDSHWVQDVHMCTFFLFILQYQITMVLLSV